MSELGSVRSRGCRRSARGTPLGALIAERAELADGDVVVVSQKVVSKAEGRVRRLSAAIPERRGAQAGGGARQGAEPGRADPPESRRVIRAERSVLIVETHHGFVCANAGIDSSNLPEPDTVCLLPEDPDASARRLRAEIARGEPGSPSASSSPTASAAPGGWARPRSRSAAPGSPRSTTGAAARDAGGRQLEATAIAIADEAAAAADLVRDKAAGVPAAVVRGLGHHVGAEDGPGAAALRRPAEEDLFR